MKIENDKKLDFNDVLFRPKRSQLSSRSQVNIERDFIFPNSKRKWKGVPIISSNMDTISSIEMFKSLSKHKMITCFHKFIKTTCFITFSGHITLKQPSKQTNHHCKSTINGPTSSM